MKTLAYIALLLTIAVASCAAFTADHEANAAPHAAAIAGPEAE